LRDRSSEARASLGLAKCAFAKEDFKSALEQAQRARELSRRGGERGELSAAATVAGRSLRALGRNDEARRAFEEAIGQTEQVRTEVAGGAIELESFFSTQVAPYEEMISLLVEARSYPEALAMAERASSRTLLDIVAAGKPDLERSLNEKERERSGQLGRKVAESNHALNLASALPQADEEKIVALEAALGQARDARDSYQAELLALHPDWKRAVSSAQPAPIEEIEHLATGHDRAFLKFATTPTETFLFVLRENKAAPMLQVFSPKLSGEQLAQRVASFRESLATRSLGWQEPARQLYDALLKESEPAWKDAERIVVSPDGPLWELPFQALETADGRCLVERHTMSYTPSLSFLVRSGSHATPDSSKAKLLAVGNPALGNLARASSSPAPEKRELETPATVLMGESWQPLPVTEHQLTELEKIYGADHTRLLLGEGAQEDDFKSNAASFNVLHFATHGVLNDRAPMYSYLLFAQTHLGPEQDGLLEARELMQMNLGASLAVLSGCETARGSVRAGEGMIGLSWSFLLAGCPATVVSQWKVESESNTDLMIDFHRRLHAGSAAAEALQAASVALAKKPEYRHPFYWAPFVVVGESR
jgi:CHAT domain-containing protein